MIILRQYKTGFTLIEITIALLVLAVGLIGILALFPVGFDALKTSGNITVATFLGQEKLEEAKRVGYVGVDGDDSMVTPNTRFSDPYAYYAYAFSVTPNVDGLDLKEVKVEVYWPADADGSPANRSNQRFIELITYIVQYEM